jgi:adenylate cyclase
LALPRFNPLPEPVEQLVREAEVDAERVVGWVRITIGLVLLAGGLFVAGTLGPTTAHVPRRAGLLSIAAAAVAFCGLGVVSLVVVARGWYRHWMTWVLATGDAAIVVLALHQGLAASGLAGNWIAALPAVWAAPIVLSVGALRYSPAVQLWVTATLMAGAAGVALAAGFSDFPPGRSGAEGSGIEREVGRLFALRAYAIRVMMVALIGLTTLVVMVRARRLLVRAVSETARRASLARFLPAEIVPLVEKHQIGSLRRGRRQQATLLFVDMRDSTALAEQMEPERLSVFVSAFRRRVARAAQAHRGVVDKFIGDGALLVFGTPEPAPDDPARALACARTLLALIERWNAKRRFDPPVRIGIGVHAGEVYCGVIGDEQRLEFTVLGDAVNVAARIEQATKTRGVPFLASEAVVAAAGETGRWHEVSREPLRGRTEPMAILAPDP